MFSLIKTTNVVPLVVAADVPVNRLTKLGIMLFLTFALKPHLLSSKVFYFTMLATSVSFYVKRYKGEIRDKH